MKVVIVVDKTIASSPFGKKIVMSMSETFYGSNQVKCLIQDNDIPRSIQWMKNDGNNNWVYQEHIFILYPRLERVKDELDD